MKQCKCWGWKDEWDVGLFLEADGPCVQKDTVRLSAMELTEGAEKERFTFTDAAKTLGTALRLEKWECFPKEQIWGRAFYTLGTAWAKAWELPPPCPAQNSEVLSYSVTDSQTCVGAFGQVQEARAEQRWWGATLGESGRLEQVLCRPSLDSGNRQQRLGVQRDNSQKHVGKWRHGARQQGTGYDN